MYWYPSYPSAVNPGNLLLAGGSVAASTQNAYWPVANLYQSPLACDVWRSATATDGTESLTITFATQSPTLTSGHYPQGLDLLVDTWNADSTCSSWSVELVGPGTTHTYSAPPAAAPARFNFPLDPTTPTTGLVITFTRSGTNYIQVGKLFAGFYLDSGTLGSPDNNNFTRTFNEIVNNAKSTLGQRFNEMRAQYWSGKITIPYITEALQTNLRQAIFEGGGTFTPFWLIIYPGDPTTSEMGWPRYCQLTAVPTEKLTAYGNGFYWALNISVEKLL